MVSMAKLFLLLLVVYRAMALEDFGETHSVHELNPYSSPVLSSLSYPPPSSPSPAPSPIPAPYAPQDISRADCVKKCQSSCTQRDSFVRKICINICTANKCPKASVDDISCILRCAQSSTDSLRYGVDANMEVSCYNRCKRD